jgi:uncharacterized membrane protein
MHLPTQEGASCVITEHVTTEQKTPGRSVISRTRLECLFDGIFAIAMTILVLELKVPDLADRHSVNELLHKLATYGPTFGSYALSFLILGMFWYRHNEQHHHCQSVTRSMLALQLVQLAIAAFFPFCAALLGRYPTNHLSQLMYAGCVSVYLWVTLGNWLEAGKRGALKPEVSLMDFRRIRLRVLRSCAASSAGLVLVVAQMLAH